MADVIEYTERVLYDGEDFQSHHEETLTEERAVDLIRRVTAVHRTDIASVRIVVAYKEVGTVQ